MVRRTLREMPLLSIRKSTLNLDNHKHSLDEFNFIIHSFKGTCAHSVSGRQHNPMYVGF